jgi:hypothetical protein
MFLSPNEILVIAGRSKRWPRDRSLPAPVTHTSAHKAAAAAPCGMWYCGFAMRTDCRLHPAGAGWSDRARHHAGEPRQGLVPRSWAGDLEHRYLTRQRFHENRLRQQSVGGSAYAAGLAATPAGCCLQDGGRGVRRDGSASITQTCAGSELLFARSAAPGPTSQTCAAECFRSRAELLFARSYRRRFRSRSCCCRRFRSAVAGCFCRYCFQ